MSLHSPAMKQSVKPFLHFCRPVSTAFNAIKLHQKTTRTPIHSSFLIDSVSTPEQKSPNPVQQLTKTATSSSQIIKSVELKPPNSIQIKAFSSVTSDPSQKPEGSMGSEFSPSNTIPVVSTFTSPFEHSPSIDASSSIRKPLSLWPGMYNSPVTNALWEARSSIFERLIDPPKDAPPQSELLTKTPAQSRTSILYNFSTDYVLREQYRDPWNEVRIGKLLEDLDALAGTISVKHCCNDDSLTRPLLLVTASVDKIILKKPIRVDTDLKIAGSVVWVGRSSIEIQLEVTQPIEESSHPSNSIALTANFTFVARDSKTGKSAPVNRISPETQQEKKLWEEAEARNKLRKLKRGQHKKDLANGEVDRLEALLAEGRIFCDMPALANRDSILMRDTRLQNSLICQPQQRNMHGRIFGGFLMNRAFELAFSTAYAFAGMVPCFLEVDHVDFLKPVDVGDFLRLKSCVLYTELDNPELPLINIEVVAHVTRPELRSSEVSNTFHFTFTVRPEAMKNGLRIRSVVPATEEEARRVLDRMDAENSQFIY
ncbi:PREDICTED: acyl-coenzyme A thioesterase 9, mitochondrial-like isoform X2 [Nelumbo nucifera]|uniref:Acyl-coenzyme A thioesterase 9, mitochondrial-like isoform X2 n=1 Tax=Nelumbo nucifera TaxID=4432 RepID=A0A1U7YQW1_NELNU|nr:PREDICTED: acyl-coenzyme A thioesterase 9, mitochondrial-like isoform X2 [Nelumbo nucifera]